MTLKNVFPRLIWIGRRPPAAGTGVSLVKTVAEQKLAKH
jgi:hypothetical protein